MSQKIDVKRRGGGPSRKKRSLPINKKKKNKKVKEMYDLRELDKGYSRDP